MISGFSGTVDKDGNVEWRGLETGKTRVHTKRKDIVVFHIAPSTHWHAFYQPRSYDPARYLVCRVEWMGSEGLFKIREVYAEFPAVHRKGGAA